MNLLDRLLHGRPRPEDWIALREGQKSADARERRRRQKRQPRREAKPVRFVSAERAFKPQGGVRALRDLNGWVDRSRPERGKWSLSAGHVGCVSREKYAVKGYVVVLDDLEGEA